MKSLLTNWKTSLAGGLAILLPALHTFLGLDIPGIPVPDFGAGTLTLGLGLLFAKDGNVTGGNVPQVLPHAVSVSGVGVIKKEAGAAVMALAIGALALLAPGAALAADMPIKAPLASPAPGFDSGWEFGVFGEGGGGNVKGSIAGVNPNEIVTNQAGVYGQVGYIWSKPGGTLFYELRGDLGFRNLNSSQPGLSLSGPLSGDFGIEVGAPTNLLLSVLPSLGLPTAASWPVLPNGATVTNTRTSIAVLAHFDDISADVIGMGSSNRAWRVAPKLEALLSGQVSNGTVLKAWTYVTLTDRAGCIGPGSALGCVGLGPQFGVGAGVFW